MKKKIVLLAVVCIVAWLCVAVAIPCKADAGTVYSCQIKPAYSHPVTGEIEDAGGESGSATGQGMVEGSVSEQGMLEQTDSGKYYLTFRITLMDYTSKHSFSVQKWGDTSWKDVARTVTKTGEDENGSTADMRIEVPAKDCVVRVCMNVEAMGREVIFYLYPYNLKQGQPSDMNAMIVTDEQTTPATQTPAKRPEKKTKQKAEEKKTQKPVETPAQKVEKETVKKVEKGAAQKAEKGAAEKTEKETEQETESESGKTGGETSSQSEMEKKEQQGLILSTESEVSDAQGMNDTEEMAGAEDTSDTEEISGSSLSMLQWILVLTVSMTMAGLILIVAAALAVKYFLDNKWKWFDDDLD